MPRRPDTPCVDCGEMMWRGTGSLPAGQAMCRKCRADRRSRLMPLCPMCGAPYQPVVVGGGRRQQTCSRSCGQVYAAKLRGVDPASARAKDRARCALRRQRSASQFVEYVDPDVVFQRDGWRCHICSRRIDQRLDGRSPMGPTIDHLIPLSAGGEHSYANVASAHRRCNLRRGVGGQVQLALIG